MAHAILRPMAPPPLQRPFNANGSVDGRRLRVLDVPRRNTADCSTESSHVRRHVASAVRVRLSAFAVHAAVAVSGTQDLHPRQDVRRILRARRPQVTNDISLLFVSIIIVRKIVNNKNNNQRSDSAMLSDI